MAPGSFPRRPGERALFAASRLSAGMTLEGAIRVLAGTFVLLGLLLSRLLSPWWLLLDAFVGLNLIQSSFTGFCPAEIVFRRLGVGAQASRA